MSVDPLADKNIVNSPYSYCNGNPITLVDPDGNLPQMVVGALVSAGVDIALQVGDNMINHHMTFKGALKSMDWRSVGASAVAGAVGVGVVTKCKQAAQLYKVGKVGVAMATEIGAVAGDATGSVASQAIQNGTVSSEKVRDDVVIGAVGNLVGKGVLKAVQKTGAFNDLTEKAVSASRRAEARPDLNKNTRAATQAAEAVENYGANTSQAVSSAATTTIQKTHKTE